MTIELSRLQTRGIFYVIPETLPPGSLLPKGSVIPETFVVESVIQDTFQDYHDLHFPDSPIEESQLIIPDSLGGRLFTDEEVTCIVQCHFPQRKPVGDVGFKQQQPQLQLPMHSSPVRNND